MPPTAQAAVMRAFGQPITVEPFPLPNALAPGDLLVKVTLAGMCGTDVHLHRGELKVPLPLIMGHETTGVIAAIGPSVPLLLSSGGREAGAMPTTGESAGPRPADFDFSTFRSFDLSSDWLGLPLAVGDRVSWTVGRACGQCEYCRLYNLPSRCRNRKAYGVTTPCDHPPHLLGGYAQYHHLAAGTAIFKLPDDLPDEAVVGAGCALVTVIHGFERMPVRWGESVVVQGAGPVGLAAVALAADAGARPIIAIGSPADRLARCRQFGADVVIDIDEIHNPAKRRGIVLEHTRGLGADLVVECVGRPEAVAEGWDLCRDGGRYLVLGQYCDAGPTPLNPHLITRKELTIAGSYGSEPRHWAASLAFLAARRARFPFDQLITHRFRLDQVNEALAKVAAWQTGKAVICPNE